MSIPGAKTTCKERVVECDEHHDVEVCDVVRQGIPVRVVTGRTCTWVIAAPSSSVAQHLHRPRWGLMGAVVSVLSFSCSVIQFAQPPPYLHSSPPTRSALGTEPSDPAISRSLPSIQWNWRLHDLNLLQTWGQLLTVGGGHPVKFAGAQAGWGAPSPFAPPKGSSPRCACTTVGDPEPQFKILLQICAVQSQGRRVIDCD